MAKDTKNRSEVFRQQLTELDTQYHNQRRQDQTEVDQQLQRSKMKLDRQHPHTKTKLDQQRQFKAELDKRMKAVDKIVEDGHAEALRLVQTSVSKFEENLTKYIKAELEEKLDEDKSNA